MIDRESVFIDIDEPSQCAYEGMYVIKLLHTFLVLYRMNTPRRTRTNVQKGSLVQALLKDDDNETYIYLLAKVEHSEWVDDTDFTFKTGFSKNKKLCGNHV